MKIANIEFHAIKEINYLHMKNKKLTWYSILVIVAILVNYALYNILSINDGTVLNATPISSNKVIIQYREFFSDWKNKFNDDYRSDWIICRENDDILWKFSIDGDFMHIGNQSGLVINEQYMFLKYQQHTDSGYALRIRCVELNDGKTIWDKMIELNQSYMHNPIYSDLMINEQYIISFCSHTNNEDVKCHVVNATEGNTLLSIENLYTATTAFTTKNHLFIHNNRREATILVYDFMAKAITDTIAINDCITHSNGYFYHTKNDTLYRYNTTTLSHEPIFTQNDIENKFNLKKQQYRLFIDNLIVQKNLLYASIYLDNQSIIVYDLSTKKLTHRIEQRNLRRVDHRTANYGYFFHSDTTLPYVLNYNLQTRDTTGAVSSNITISTSTFEHDLAQLEKYSQVISQYNNNFLFYNFLTDKFHYYRKNSVSPQTKEFALTDKNKETINIEHVRYRQYKEYIVFTSRIASSSYGHNRFNYFIFNTEHIDNWYSGNKEIGLEKNMSE